ncbi:hypothetical protein V8G54_026918 [Vigna mungo]|uniref:Helicase ATP-binding domain-containing protein n=1 Tax=Vigna mungo TaxID=3915 RepID=A0AAQ3RMK7_VIGMU
MGADGEEVTLETALDGDGSAAEVKYHTFHKKSRVPRARIKGAWGISLVLCINNVRSVNNGVTLGEIESMGRCIIDVKLRMECRESMFRKELEELKFEKQLCKTLIAIMLLRSYAHHLRKPSPFSVVFLVPQVVWVSQQAEVVKMHTDLKVGTYRGDMGVDYWDGATWKRETEKHEVLVMTLVILLNCLRRSFFKLNMIKVLIMDECHHARGKHPYACIMTALYRHFAPLRVGVVHHLISWLCFAIVLLCSDRFW